MSLKLELQNMKKDGYIVLKGVKIWQKQQAPAEEGAWQEVKTYSFTQEAEEAGNYTIKGDNGNGVDCTDQFEKIYTEDGMTLNKLSTYTSVYAEFTYQFDTILENGKYYVEFEYTENAPTNGQLNITPQGSDGKEVASFAVNRMAPINMALRYDNNEGTQRVWLKDTHPEELAQHNTNHEKERLGFVYDLSLIHI